MHITIIVYYESHEKLLLCDVDHSGLTNIRMFLAESQWPDISSYIAKGSSRLSDTPGLA